MRFLFGVMFGIILTVTAAYYYDATNAPPPGTATTGPRPLVNWDVATDVARGATRTARLQFDRLTGN